MKQFSLLAFLPTIALAKTVYYSDQVRHVDLRSTSPSLLMFNAPVISATCQPAWVEFQSLSSENLAINEQSQVQARSLEGQKPDESELIKKMLRIKPLRKTGASLCSFVLTNGEEISTQFQLQENITTPLVDFKPFAAIETGQKNSPELYTLNALLKGEPIGTLEKREDHKVCRHEKNNRKRCRNYKFSTDTARYEVLYLGKNAKVSAWVVEAKLKKNLSFKEVADIKTDHGLIRYSLTTPQPETYRSGAIVKHHLIGLPSLTKEDLQGVMP